MGSSHDLPTRRKRRNSDCISNYVDRVRICDTKSIASESVYSKASSQKSGWRQKSYSSIDLRTSDFLPGAGAFRYRDFDSQDDISIKNLKNNKNKEIQRDYEDIYNVNPKAQGYKRDVIKEHNEININKRDSNEICSLRRSKSLAVIREETFNDLTIDGPKSRRSQLIPRAKLIDRNFFRSRLSFALEEGLSFSLDSNLTNENSKSNSNTNTIKSSKSSSKNNSNSLSKTKSGNNNSNNNNLSWNCDKSDLSSIDSNFFKNSLHQSALLDKSNATDSTQIVSRVEVHNENDSNSCDNNAKNGSVKTGKEKSENIINSNNNNRNNDDNENSVNINEDTESGITIIEIKDKKQLSGPTSSVISYDSIYLSSESDKQTILGDDEEFTNFDDIDLKIKDFEKIIKELNLIGGSEKSDAIIDNLYCQVAKGSNTDLKTNSEESKLNTDTFGKYTDYISKGTLERLAILSGFSSINSYNSKRQGIDKNKKNIKDYEINDSALSTNKGHFQYSSLPDVDISKLLRDCELIDAKLRDDVSIELLEPYPDYDIDLESIDPNNTQYSNSIESSEYDLLKEEKEEIAGAERSIDHIDKCEKVVNDRINSNNTIINAQISNNEPPSLEEENPKGAPSIELVQLSTKELKENPVDNKSLKDKASEEREKNTTKIYIPDLGLELDYENSIASFNSEEDEFESPTDDFNSVHNFKDLSTPKDSPIPFYKAQALNLITISGKKVIIDELAAKTEQQQKENKENGNIEESFSCAKLQQSLKAKPRQKSLETERKECVSADIIENPSCLISNKKVSQNKKVIERLNCANNSNQRHKAHIDKRKINFPERKQPSKSSNTDKKILLSNNTDSDDTYTTSADTKEKENVCEEKIISSEKKAKKSKDFSSFCILQKSNSINSYQKKMPRPQLLNIIDSKNSIPKQQQQQQEKHVQQQPSKQKTTSNNSGMEVNKDERTILTELEDKQSLNITEKEFLHKVDSVRNYWSRMLDNEIIEMKENNLKSMSKVFSTSKSSNDIPQTIRSEERFQSFFPTVEIIELNNGETQAALVTARKLNDVEFDHVRYKVMKSEMFQKNIARSNNHRKETQFDGLMQYLQDYSFQELLAKNNVVIIEPVRTKIEKVTEKPNKSSSAACKITNGATQLHRSGSNNLKKHFFYQPIRVNKELYEDELPVPDTVRNVRKLFEDSVRLSCTSSQLSESAAKLSKSSDNLKPRKTIRYLTIDTSFDNNLATSKWDSISLSSGVSSAADLSSPCECHDGNLSRNIYNSRSESKENLESDRNYSVDVREKTREYGSTKTQMYSESHKFNQDVTTKPAAKDVGTARGEKCNCNWRQPRNNFSTNEKYQLQQSHKKMNNDYTGLKFKLVKSNSCSSRLELAGTGIGEINAVEEMRNIVHGQQIQLYDENEEYDCDNIGKNEHIENECENKEDLEHEETVKDMIYKLEAKNFPATTKPRIIESRCIEKVPKDVKVTINNQTFENSSATKSSNINSPTSHIQTPPYNVELKNENVTVNNHISFLNETVDATTAESHNPMQNEDFEIVNVSNGNKISSIKPKIVRNRNVDLAMLALNKKNDVTKGLCNSDIKSLPLAQKHGNNEIQEISNNHHNNERKSRDIISSAMMQSVEMVKNQDKINCSHFAVKNHPQMPVDSSLSSNKSSMESARQSLEEQHQQHPVKMVNWGTVGILNKEYVANDNKLVQLKPYDEMEFEEFEVAGEHYDSLNSK